MSTRNYILPSQCTACAPVETHGYDTTELAHETTCPNRIKGVAA